MSNKKQLKRLQGMKSISLPLALPGGQEKVVEIEISTTQDRLQYNESHGAFLWLRQN
jgi:hypothetical protein